MADLHGLEIRKEDGMIRTAQGGRKEAGRKEGREGESKRKGRREGRREEMNQATTSAV